VADLVLVRPFERTVNQAKKTTIWHVGAIAALVLGFGSCRGSAAISKGRVYSYRECADGWQSPSIGIQGACSHHGGVVTRHVDERTDTQRYECYGFDAAGTLGFLTALILWSGGPPPRRDHSSQSLAATPPVDTPRCPRCSRHMIRRRARRGRHAGHYFWGCSAYPSCRGTRPGDTTRPNQTLQPTAGRSDV